MKRLVSCYQVQHFILNYFTLSIEKIIFISENKNNRFLVGKFKKNVLIIFLQWLKLGLCILIILGKNIKE